jgi:demethylmenaquinone methyltransferase/2-methoxy-6-polyprenyl-1,4-benzoquinol methylase
VPDLTTDRPRTPQALFDRVAPYYDAMNSVLSFGMDRRWRREAAATLELAPGSRVLDVATGTGSLASAVARAAAGTVSVTGCDVNERMLSIARARVRRSGLPVELVHADAMKLPFADASFDAVTIAFAIDDMPDRDACAIEMKRVLRPGGRLVLLELGQPDGGALRAMYRGYLRVFRVANDGYKHLEREIRGYRGAEAIEALVTRVGFIGYVRRSLTGGIARLHVAEKPEVRA